MASAKTSPSQEVPLLRDYRELEGTLLPSVHMVVATAEDSLLSSPTAPAGKCTSTSGPLKYATVLSYEDEDCFNAAGATTTTTIRPHHTHLQPDAISHAQATALVFPVDPYNNEKDDDLYAAELMRVGEARGRLLNEMEQEEIRRNIREIRAIRYHEKEALREANERARQVQGNEDAGFVQTTIAMEYNNHDNTTRTTTETTPAEPQQPEYQGTFGRDYEVSEYEGRDYEIKEEYDVAEYKSVYES